MENPNPFPRFTLEGTVTGRPTPRNIPMPGGEEGEEMHGFQFRVTGPTATVPGRDKKPRNVEPEWELTGFEGLIDESIYGAIQDLQLGDNVLMTIEIIPRKNARGYFQPVFGILALDNMGRHVPDPSVPATYGD